MVLHLKKGDINKFDLKSPDNLGAEGLNLKHPALDLTLFLIFMAVVFLLFFFCMMSFNIKAEDLYY
jgi:hypothetical protein